MERLLDVALAIIFALMVGCASVDPGPVRAGATIEYGETGGDTEDVCDQRSGWGQC